MNRIRTSLLVIALFLAPAPTAIASNTWYVDGVKGNDSNDCKSSLTACKTIGGAISLASSRDSIIVAAATYTENLTIGFSLSLIGSGASATIIDGGGLNRVVTISNAGAKVTLSGVTIRNGTTPYAGGGIYNGGILSVIASTVSGNKVTNHCSYGTVCSGQGGGISNKGTLTISDSTISGNTAQISCNPLMRCVVHVDGGGIFNYGAMVMSNSTLASNIVGGAGFGIGTGGAISNQGSAIISNSTLSGNSATGGADGIKNYQGQSLALQNSIVARSSASSVSPSCSGTVTSNGYNLSSDNTCIFGGPGDLNNINPQLGPLQNNGGTTQTMALLTGSPAIDAGNPNGCTDGNGNLLKTDQRGMPRPDLEDTLGCDMGAYESQSDQP